MTVEEAMKWATGPDLPCDWRSIYAIQETLAAEVDRLRGGRALGDALNRAEAAEQATANLLHAVDTMDEAKAIRDKILVRVISERDELSREVERLQVRLADCIDQCEYHAMEADQLRDLLDERCP